MNLNFPVSNTIMRNCVKRAISYNPSIACGTAKNNDEIPRENNISHNKNVVPVNPRLTSPKHLTKLHTFEEIDQKLVSNLSTLKINEIKADEEILSQDISQNALNKSRSLSGCDEKNSALSLVQLTEKEDDSSIGTAKILEKYFAICNTILSDNAQCLIDRESNVSIESSKEQSCINETREKLLINEDSVLFGHKLTLIVPRCNCATNSEQAGKVAKSDQESEESNEKSKYIIILASGTDICYKTTLLHDASDETEKYAIYSLNKQDEEQIVLLYPDENTCQQTKGGPFYHTTLKKQAQECVADLTETKPLANELLILIRQMYYAERSMLYIGLIDVIRSMEKNLAEFVILAEDVTHLLAPLDFLTRLTQLAEAKNIPYIYLCKKKQLGQACCVSTTISAISIRIGPSYFSEEINKIKCTISTASRKTSVASDIFYPSSN